MRTERIKVEPQSFASIIDALANGLYRIPRFQRKFVWERSRIQSLLDSMYREYPIGTVFLWKAPAHYNHMLRSIEYLNQPKVDPSQPYTFILDGQQRLTSLYVTVNGRSIGGEDYGKIVADLGGDESNGIFQYRKPDGRRWVAVHDLLKENMFDIYDNLSTEYRQRFQDIRQRLYRYPFSVVTVNSMEIDDAIEIFERINQQSKSLTRYDLIAASVLTDNFDLRERSQTDIIDPLRATFGSISETNVPQALALNIEGRTEHATQMGLTTEQVQKVWERTVECLKLAVDFMKANLGVKRADFIPYNAMLPVLGYYFFYAKTNAIRSSFERDQLEKWFWRTAFSERYSGASQTKMTEDAFSIKRLIDSSTPFEFDTMPVTLDERALMQASMRGTASAVRNGVLCMLCLRKPLHFLNSSEIVISGEHFSKFTRAERHHIFPAGYLQSSDINLRRIHSIPNFCLIPADLNQQIGDSKPSQYFKDLRGKHGDSGEFEKIMKTHLIYVEEDSGIWTDDYDKFLNQRARLLIKEIRYLCGLTERIVEGYRNPIIDTIERRLRDKIHEVLSSAFGHEYWGSTSVPNDVRERAKERIEDLVSKTPGLERQQFREPRIKLDHCDVSDYVKIIVNSSNWPHFAKDFRSKGETERYLNDFKNFRNTVKHNRSIDPLMDLQGQTAVLWLTRALRLDLSEYGVR